MSHLFVLANRSRKVLSPFFPLRLNDKREQETLSIQRVISNPFKATVMSLTAPLF